MKRIFFLALWPLFLAACGSQPPRPVIDHSANKVPTVRKGDSLRGVLPAPTFKAGTPEELPGDRSQRPGGYYKDDGPGDNPPENIEAIPDAVPRDEPLNRFANNKYSVFGKDYVPLDERTSYKETGIASWYGRKFHGQKTSSGEIYDMYGMTAAHPTLPIPSYVRVTNQRNGKSVVLRVNDRGPFHANRVIDLSWVAAYKLGYLEQGSTQVEVESILSGSRSSRQPIIFGGSSKAVSSSLPEVSRLQGHFIQVGAFGNRDNAEALRGRLARELGSLGDKLVIDSTGGSFRVQLGPWADSSAAEQARNQVRENFGLTAIIVQR
ncbi:MAG: septal ring lytic transglycosylase RlpA family protein [Rugosibacter sp.]|nr:septal ring lytic transglycosylase RlpA family protein [Rugosibacter sp.]